MSAPSIEILFFHGCPNHVRAGELVKRVCRELGISPKVDYFKILDQEAAARSRFLGSPTIRVDGRDIEPGADSRTDFVVACRVYRTAGGLGGLPDEAWLRDALRSSEDGA